MPPFTRDTRPVSWFRAARKEFQAFPREAQDRVFQALSIAAEGRKADIAKPLKGFGPGIYEVAFEFRRGAWRIVYAVGLGADIWVLHAFQKKATSGVRTPKRELDVIRKRLARLKREIDL